MGIFNLLGLLFETLNECMSDPPPFFLRLCNTGQRVQKLFFRRNHVQVCLKMF